MLHQYPQREYPEPEPEDPKGNKRGQAKKEEPKKKKKKKKKEPPFPTPEWALELPAVIDTIKKIEVLIVDRDNLNLTEEFIKGVHTELDRFKKEVKFRKDEEEAKRLADEEKKKRKAAKKKANK